MNNENTGFLTNGKYIRSRIPDTDIEIECNLYSGEMQFHKPLSQWTVLETKLFDETDTEIEKEYR